MNIVEAYIKFNGELIILISGLSGSGKTKIAKNIERDFKISMIDAEMYCKKDFNKKVELPGGNEVIDWDDIESFDWQTINKLANDSKSKGIVICAPYFTTDVLTILPSFHVHIKIQKQSLIEARKIYVEENKEKCKDFGGLEGVIVNQITYPHYLEYLKTSKIDKFINSKDMTLDQIYDETTNFLFFKIEQYLEEYNKKIVGNKRSEKDESSDSLGSTSEKSIDSDEEVFLGTQYDENLEKNYY
jgi:uridine kinase